MAQPGIIVLIDPSVVNSVPGPFILRSLSSSEDNPLISTKRKTFTYRVQPLEIYSSISWVFKKNKKDLEWSLSPQHLIILKGSELGELIFRNGFDTWLSHLNCSKNVTVVVYQYQSYFGQVERFAQKKKTARVRGETLASNQGPIVTHLHAQKALCDAQLKHGINYIIFNTDYDKIGDVVYHYTRAISECEEKERKRISSDDYGFYAPSAKGNIAVNSNGIGCLNLWQNWLMQISHFVGIDRAKAITNIYPSPSALIKALSRAEYPEKLLADIQVRRGADLMTGGSIKIGIEASRKIAKMFLSLDGNEMLQK
ncbi:crossover junction endonuclease EME1 [Lepeophtheirus salmonis]|uniref:crossover junction endonuclease EME1 n=1 Tax=Lepeophtheirus salmonis TaxID=72036 RepID=UPI001AE5376A|nr:crossover junction endonuclease EME1-like [Lepeophtheirus salmonis]